LAVLGGAALVSAFFLSGSSPENSNKIVSTKPVSESNTLPSSKIWVHIVGAVQNPGVYSMPPGSRVFELIAEAGGLSKLADQSSINLARNLTDGEQISVLARGAALDTPSQSTSISLNSASEATLETLPGVGPKLAARMVDWRNANFGFKMISDLRKVGGIGDKLFAQIKDLVSL
jgi:competence protein ComEA